jgi:gluconolactonase
MPLQADGSVSKAGQFFTSHGPSGPDGLAFDAQGHLFVANPGLGYVWMLNACAEVVQVLQGSPSHSLTNLAFGGAARQSIFVTDSTAGTILTAQMPTAGAVVYGGKGG